MSLLNRDISLGNISLENTGVTNKSDDNVLNEIKHKISPPENPQMSFNRSQRNILDVPSRSPEKLVPTIENVPYVVPPSKSSLRTGPIEAEKEMNEINNKITKITTNDNKENKTTKLNNTNLKDAQEKVVLNSNVPGEVDYSLLGAKPKTMPSKLPLLKSLPKKVEIKKITRKQCLEESGQQKSEDKTDMKSNDKDYKIIDKIDVMSDDKKAKIVDKIGEAGEKSAVEDCKLNVPLKPDIGQQMKAKQTYMLKLKSCDPVGSTASLSPIRGSYQSRESS